GKHEHQKDCVQSLVRSRRYGQRHHQHGEEDEEEIDAPALVEWIEPVDELAELCMDKSPARPDGTSFTRQACLAVLTSEYGGGKPPLDEPPHRPGGEEPEHDRDDRIEWRCEKVLPQCRHRTEL